jgi:DNA polymerase III alpha subunit
VAGLVVARQRPETARGYTFILMEDEAGMTNTIIRPDVYERDRVAIRGEPFLWILGTLARDDGTLNIIAEEVRPLALGRGRPSGSEELALRGRSPYRFLKRLRQNAPAARSWG